jgi:hypothetical protein
MIREEGVKQRRGRKEEVAKGAKLADQSKQVEETKRTSLVTE